MDVKLYLQQKHSQLFHVGLISTRPHMKWMAQHVMGVIRKEYHEKLCASRHGPHSCSVVYDRDKKVDDI